MLPRIGKPGIAAPASGAKPAAAAPVRQRPRRTLKRPAVPMTGEAVKVVVSRLPDLVRYEAFEGRMRRRWVPGFTRRGPGVPAGWMEEGSPEGIAARKAAGL